MFLIQQICIQQSDHFPPTFNKLPSIETKVHVYDTLVNGLILGIVAIGGEPVSISKQSGSGLSTNRKRLRTRHSEPNWVSDDDGGDDDDDDDDDDNDQPVKTVQKKKKGIVATGGEAVDKAKEL